MQGEWQESVKRQSCCRPLVDAAHWIGCTQCQVPAREAVAEGVGAASAQDHTCLWSEVPVQLRPALAAGLTAGTP